MDWLPVLVLALQLMNTVRHDGACDLDISWSSPDKYNWNCPACDSVLVLEVKEKDVILACFAFIPTRELYELQRPEQLEAFPPQLYTVTGELMVFELPCTITLDDSPPRDAFLLSMEKLLDYQHYNTGQKVTTSIPSHYQVLDLKEYPAYADLSIAVPGSKALDPSEIKALFPGKMIRVRMVPDQGSIRTSWLKGEGESIPEAVTEVFRSSLEEALNSFEAENRQQIFENAKKSLHTSLSNDPIGESRIDYYVSLLRRYFLLEDPVTPIYTLDDAFPDYQPKQTPDIAADFNPGITPVLDSLPEIKRENLKALLALFREYKKGVRKNPGEWVEGNPLLGARDKEYIPSMEELVLNEIGDRVKILLEEHSQKEKRRILRKAWIPVCKRNYTQYTFVHYDVMGSGRFFYVESMDEKSLTE